MRRLFRACLLIAASAVLAPAHADALPAPTSGVTCDNDMVHIERPLDCASGGAAAEATLLPFAGSRAQAAAPASVVLGGATHGSGAFAVVHYAFEVVGGTAGTLVPLLVTASLEASASSIGHALGFASVIVQTSQQTVQVCVATNGFGCPQTAFAGTFSVLAQAGGGGAVEIETSASAGDSPNDEWAQAAADPLIRIDPAFADAAQYAVVLSDGVGNGVAPVPEPPPRLLLAAGMFLLAARLRWRGQR